MAKQKKSESAGLSPRQKYNILFLLISMGLALTAAVVMLIPVSVETESKRIVVYNMLGALNQDLGLIDTRAVACAELLVFFCGIIFTAVGVVGVYNKIKSSALFIFAGSVLFIVFAGMWLGDSTRGQSAAKLAFTHSIFLYAMIVLSVGAAFCALMSVNYYIASRQVLSLKRNR